MEKNSKNSNAASGKHFKENSETGEDTREYAAEIERQSRIFNTILSSITDFVYILDRDGRFVYSNQALLDLLGITSEEIIGKNFFDLDYPQDLAERLQSQIQQVFKTKERLVDETPFTNAAGTGGFYEYIFSPVINADGSVEVVASSTRDITAHKRAELNLAFLVEISQDLARWTGINEMMQTVGAKIGTFLNLSNCAFMEINEAVGEAAVTHEWHREDAPDLTGVYRIEEFVTGEFQRASRAGEIFVVRDTQTDSRTDAVSYAALKVASFASVPLIRSGEWRFLLVIFDSQAHEWRTDEIELIRELTFRIWTRLERARAEENLRESEEQLRALADSIPQLAWMSEPDGFIFWYNRRWYDYTGTTAEEMAGWGWQSVHDAEMLPNVLERWQASIETGEPFEMEFPLRRGADGAFRWFLTRVVPLRDTNGRIMRWFGTNTDIEELRQARLQAEAANRLKDEFLATVSHELRTPLNAILGWSEMLKSGKAIGEIADRANETIYRNAKSQAQLIEDLLDVSRIITGKLNFDPRPVQFSSVIKAALNTFRPAVDSKSIELEAHLDCEPCMVGGDEQRLQQIVWNLISNAVKFTPEGGKIEIKLENDNSRARLIVSDTGKGIEAEFLPFIFERFRQEDASSTRRHGGLGLGLAIVRHLVELHGGTISVKSEGENRGSIFTLELPLILAGGRNTNQKGEKAKNLRKSLSDGFLNKKQAAKQLTNIRVLLVDDEPDTLSMLDAALTIEGGEVRAANSARDALKILRDWQPDVIVSDIAMPIEDGYALIKKVRERAPEKSAMIPAIAMTAYVRVEDRMRVFASGFQMYVPKPAESDELIMAIINLVEGNKL